MWVRGLKPATETKKGLKAESHPMWVRGLKQFWNMLWHHPCEVAPYVGAWIETRPDKSMDGRRKVAPYVGAWIETFY